jgi:hypothetical protein
LQKELTEEVGKTQDYPKGIHWNREVPPGITHQRGVTRIDINFTVQKSIIRRSNKSLTA